ncbi:hypothetical protein H0H92_005130 [Tricholoma furcatifolium]|nr:hypothetical protein H0H92_005130 [Tricholoma furcatifolium]
MPYPLTVGSPFERLMSHRTYRRSVVTTVAVLTAFAFIFFWFTPPLPPHVLPFSPDDHRFYEEKLEPLPISNENVPNVWALRQDEVRRAFVHAYSGYMEHAYPADELLATSGGRSDKFNGWSVTMIDSMDTMYIMGLQNEFRDAVQAVASQKFSTTYGFYVPFFETVIRYLGGLLSAYAISGEPILLSRADDLGALLLPTFANSSSGFPAYSLSFHTGLPGSGWMGSSTLFAEIASCQLEFKYLAKLTGREEYYTAVNRVMKHLYTVDPKDGLFATKWSKSGAAADRLYTVGASADSGYEYFLKQYLLSGDTKALAQYLKSIDGIIRTLLYVTPTRGLLYAASINGVRVIHNLEHLACFLSGLLALGVHSIPEEYLSPGQRERHQWAAEGLAYTCYVSYADQKSGLGPDMLVLKPGTLWLDELAKWEDEGRMGAPPGTKAEEYGLKKDPKERDYSASGSGAYLLRPETVESLYVLWKTTGNEKWRERGYEIFNAIDQHAKTQYGYASVDKVDSDVPKQIDDMPSFFLAETLKYLFLLFDEGDIYPFSKWVFNTEAHPLPVFEWTSWEEKLYGITS